MLFITRHVYYKKNQLGLKLKQLTYFDLLIFLNQKIL